MPTALKKVLATATGLAPSAPSTRLAGAAWHMKRINALPKPQRKFVMQMIGIVRAQRQVR